MPANKCIFQKGWLWKYPWVVDNADSKVKASCKERRTGIEIDSMGESALKSHLKCSLSVKQIHSVNPIHSDVLQKTKKLHLTDYQIN